MNKVRFSLNLLAVFVFTIAFASIAQAQASRTWVSGVGDDADPCSRTAPCKTWSSAFSKTTTGGEINSIDSGGFGTLNITKSITIDGGESFSSSLAALTTGFIINAPGAHITIRNVSIDGAGNGTDGIRVLQAASVVVENVKIFGFTGQGIDWAPTSADGFLTVKNVSISQCTGGGISVANTSGFGRVSIEKSTFHRGAFGIKAGTNAVITVSESVANGATDGFLANGVGAQMNLDRCTATQNTNGIKVDNGAAIRISNCLISLNVTNGLRIVFGIIESYGTNMIRGNPLNDAPTPVLES
jgi:parallel beta helix pectate lyase-like protein